jgi:hypothetical protein
MFAYRQFRHIHFLSIFIAIILMTLASDLAFGQAYQAFKRANPSWSAYDHTLQSTSNAMPLTKGTLGSINTSPTISRQIASTQRVIKQKTGISYFSSSASNAQAGLSQLRPWTHNGAGVAGYKRV